MLVVESMFGHGFTFGVRQREKLIGFIGCDERRQEKVNGLIFSNVCARNIWSCLVC